MDGPEAAKRLCACVDGVTLKRLTPGLHAFGRLTDGDETVDEVILVPRSSESIDIVAPLCRRYFGIWIYAGLRSGVAPCAPNMPKPTLLEGWVSIENS